MKYIQGRVTASGPDAAAMKIREKYGEGKLTLLEACRVFGIYEFIIQVD